MEIKQGLVYLESMPHEFYMQQALAEARQANQEGEVPVGAVVVFQGQVIGRGHNRREMKQDPLAHAELEAIQAAAGYLRSWRLEDVALYVTLEPCLMCMGALLQARVPQLIFGALDPKAGACGSLYNLSADSRLNHQIEVTQGVCAEAASQLLQDFFRGLRGRD